MGDAKESSIDAAIVALDSIFTFKKGQKSTLKVLHGGQHSALL